MESWAPDQRPADSDQFVASPACASLTVGTGVFSDLGVMRQALVVSEDLIDGAATGGLGIQRLVQKGQEGQFGGKDAFATVVAGFIRLKQRWVDALGAKAFQVMEGMAAQSQAGVIERGMEFAKERRGGKHVSVYIPI